MMESAMNLKKLLYQKGYKYTAQREKILDVLIEHGLEHFTATDICEIVRARHSDIGMATIYRNLRLFEELNILNKLESFSKYECTISDTSHEHHHLICVKCGEITDIEGNLMTVITENLSNQCCFSLNGHSQQLYGICKNCMTQELQSAESETSNEYC